MLASSDLRRTRGAGPIASDHSKKEHKDLPPDHEILAMRMSRPGGLRCCVHFGWERGEADFLGIVGRFDADGRRAGDEADDSAFVASSTD